MTTKPSCPEVTKIDTALKVQVLVKGNRRYRLIKCWTDSKYPKERIGRCQNSNHDECDNPSNQTVTLVLTEDASGLLVDTVRHRSYWCNDCIVEDGVTMSC